MVAPPSPSTWPIGCYRSLLLSVVLSNRLVPPGEGREPILCVFRSDWSKGSGETDKGRERTLRLWEVATPSSTGPGLAPWSFGEGVDTPELGPTAAALPHCCQTRALTMSSKGTSQCRPPCRPQRPHMWAQLPCTPFTPALFRPWLSPSPH